MSPRIAPWEVGVKDAVAVVGVEGEVTAIDADTITIAGYKVPRRLGNGVRYLSMTWPDDKDACDREHVEDGNPEECGHEGVDFLLSTIESEHIDAGHIGAFRFCGNPVCKAAGEVAA